MTPDFEQSHKGGTICFQLGAREHYAVPRALHSAGALEALFTDAWVRPGSLLGRFRRSWRERFHLDLSSVTVSSVNSALLRFELSARLTGLHGWDLTIARNRWFQNQAVAHLSGVPRSNASSASPIIFAYSYAALELFRFAKTQGWRTVLGQIDGGLGEERHLRDLYRARQYPTEGRTPAPAAYWDTWEEECSLADHIVVNSDWSKHLLLSEGISPEQLKVIPLAYQPTINRAGGTREYPTGFRSERPLRVLFLGQITLRKGVLELLEAAKLLQNRPVEFWMVGPEMSGLPDHLRSQSNIRWFGPVPRGRTATFYREADVFLFPTHSDGFGLTQLEAQAWKLPLIASRFCGSVVTDDSNGRLLNEVSGNAIADVICSVLKDPEVLGKWSAGSGVAPQFRLPSVADCFLAL